MQKNQRLLSSECSNFRQKVNFSLIIPILALGLIGTIQAASASTDTYVISSGSMEPSLEVNDVVIIDKDYPFEDVQVGDIILFNRPEGSDRTIAHRVIRIQNDLEGNVVITTKGDANPSPIPGTDYPVTRDLYIGKVVNVIPDIGIITSIFSPPANYIIILGFWGGIIYAIYQRSKKKNQKLLEKDAVMQAEYVYNAAQNTINKAQFTVKNAVPNQTIIAEGGRDFKWSWLIVGIIFAWPAAIAYYFTSKKNSISVTIVSKQDNQGSAVSIQAIGHKAQSAANDLSARIQ